MSKHSPDSGHTSQKPPASGSEVAEANRDKKSNFCVVDHSIGKIIIVNSVEVPFSTVEVSLTSVAEEDRTATSSKPTEKQGESHDKEKRERFAREGHSYKSGAQVNPAFEDDDGFVHVTDYIDDGSVNSKSVTSGQDGAPKKGDAAREQVKSAGRLQRMLFPYRKGDSNAKTASTAEVQDMVKTDTSAAQHPNTESTPSTPNEAAVSPTSSQNAEADTNKTDVITRPRRTGEQGRSKRPQSRSISSLPFSLPQISMGMSADAGKGQVSRSQSMRITSTPQKAKARKLLRELTFSDTDADTVRNYGSLRGGKALPSRKSARQEEKENRQSGGSEGSHDKFPAKLKSHLLDLMQELVTRGKVHQVAVLEQDGCSLLVSWPTWTLSHQDEVGLVKSVLFTQQNMLKLTIGKEMYTFFKHGQNKMVGRAGDNVLVVETTHMCVVVGLADDNIPGSCLYEVSELVKILSKKGW